MYGIKTIIDGKVQYCTSSSRKHFSTEISECCSFVQEKTAIKAAKKLARSMNQQCDVFKVVFTEGNETLVPYKPELGYIISFIRSGEVVYYSGDKSQTASQYGDCHRTVRSINDSTVFNTEELADNCMREIIKNSLKYVQNNPTTKYSDPTEYHKLLTESITVLKKS